MKLQSATTTAVRAQERFVCVRTVALSKHRFVRLNPRHPLRSQSTSSSSSLALDSDPGLGLT